MEPTPGRVTTPPGAIELCDATHVQSPQQPPTTCLDHDTKINTGSANTSDDDGIVTGTTPRRLATLALFVAYGLATQIQFVSFSPIVRHVELRAGATALQVTLLTAVVPLVFVAALLPVLFLLHRHGIRAALLLGAGASAAAAVPKACFVVWWPQFPALLVCQALVGVGQACFVALPTHLAATWFPIPERSLATAVGTLASFTGLGLGFLIPPLVVTDGRNGDAAFGALFGAEAAFATAAFLGILLFVPAAPDLPPSKTAPQVIAQRRASKATTVSERPCGAGEMTNPLAVRPENAGTAGSATKPGDQEETTGTDLACVASNAEEESDEAADTVLSLLRGIWALRGNKDYVLLVVVFGLFNGMFLAFANVLAQVLEPLRISERHVGVMIFAGLLIGSAGAVVFGIVVDRTRRYKLFLIGQYAAMGGLMLIAAVVIQFELLSDGTAMSPSPTTNGTVPVLLNTSSSAASSLGLEQPNAPSTFNEWLPFAYAAVVALATLNSASFPVAFELCAELAHPAPPVVATTPPLAVNDTTSFFFSIAMAAVLTDTPTVARAAALVWFLAASLLVFTVIIAALVTEHRRRFDEEQADTHNGLILTVQ